jgi:hypothetical protein
MKSKSKPKWKMADYEFEQQQMEKENKMIAVAKELKDRRWTESAIIQHLVANYNENYDYVKSLLKYI